MEYVILLIIVGLIALYFFKQRGGRGRGKNSALRHKIRLMLNSPPAVADETINRHMESLRKRFPSRSEEWYLEKIIYDLERDR
jgi:hypothetical protein